MIRVRPPSKGGILIFYLINFFLINFYLINFYLIIDIDVEEEWDEIFHQNAEVKS